MEITAEMITAFGGFLAVIGVGIKFVLMRIDAKEKAIQEDQKRERDKLEKLMQMQIDQLRTDNKILREEVARYVRHVGLLEGMLRQAGIEFPRLE